MNRVFLPLTFYKTLYKKGNVTHAGRGLCWERVVLISILILCGLLFSLEPGRHLVSIQKYVYFVSNP